MSATDRPHWHGHRTRLRQKLIDRGPSALEDYELLEILLFAFIPRRDVKPVAKALLDRFGSVSAILANDAAALIRVAGVGEATAAYLSAIQELGRRAMLEDVQSRTILSSWSSLLAYVRLQLRHESREQFRGLFLDRKNQLMSDELLGHGTVDHAPVYPREIARRALELGSSAVILVHNHPSGDPTPSRADIDMTREIMDALASLDIQVHDHLIVGREGVLSFKSKGLI